MNLPEEYILRMKSLLKDEYDEYIASFDDERLYGIRANTLKTDRDEFFIITEPTQGRPKARTTMPDCTICRSPAPCPRERPPM